MPNLTVEEMTDKDIMAKLSNIGIKTSIRRFKEFAVKAGTPAVLVNSWTGVARNFVSDAALELWKRHLGDVIFSGNVSGFIQDTIDVYDDSFNDLSRSVLLDIYERVKTIHSALVNKEGRSNAELYHKLNEDTGGSLEDFLLDVSSDFERYGLVNEALEIGTWFTEVSVHPERFLGASGCILANAGRKKDALKQIRMNLKKFPESVWISIMAGDALMSLGDTKSAEKYFLKAFDMSMNKHDKEDVLVRLVDLYKHMRRYDKANRYELEYVKLSNPQKPKPIKILHKKRAEKHSVLAGW